MGRKSRHSAKTGDKSLYQSRSSYAADRGDNSDDDRMYNEVERHYNEHIDRDFLRLDDDETEEEEDDGITTKREGVFDLGMASDDDDDDDENDDQESHEDTRGEMDKAHSPPSSDEESSDDEDSSHQDNEKTDIFNWGSKKHLYYHGDTADLEIGQDENDAILEEEAGKEVQMARLRDMEEEDFILEDLVNAQQTGGTSAKNRAKRKEKSVLSRKDKMKLVKSTHPELMPVIDHFRQGLEDFVESTAIVGGALLSDDVGNEPEAVGSTPEGLQYLITKSMLQASQALNLSLYLLLKADQASSKSNSVLSIEHSDNSFLIDDDVDNIQSHPVMDRLNQLSRLTDKLRENVEDKTPGLRNQMRSLVKAAALLKGQYEDSSDESSEAKESDAEAPGVDDDLGDQQADSRTPPNQSASDSQTEASSNTDEDDESEAAMQRKILTEAKFAVRKQDIDNGAASKTSSGRTRRVAPPPSIDYGDDAEEISEKALEAGRKLASRLNSIAQKSSSVKGKNKQAVSREDDQDEYERLQRGLSMMDEEFGIGSDGGDDDEEEEEEAEGFGDGDEDDFYDKVKSKSKAKKEAKKQMYAVAPKYPRLEEEVEGERAIGRAIMKNRGLVAHKPKINRNPRVKKREQYRKALIRRKGAVREVRTGEGHVYGGESTGIKSGISRSRKLGGGR
eukprot:CCRYP_016531-RB/>CCRYP_016531-RB protein AED:0.06 eAED:0.06 QI:189/1/1/1/0.66/0.5/4/434/675